MAPYTLVFFCKLFLTVTTGALCVLAAALGEIAGTLSSNTFWPLQVSKRCLFDENLITRVVRYRDSDVYNLNTTFVWNVTEAQEGMSYEVGLAKKLRFTLDGTVHSECLPTSCSTILGASSCTMVEHWFNTSISAITLEAPYSYEYMLYIRPWNNLTGIFASGIFRADFPYEDCFKVTNDGEFCSSQDIELASAVTNLRGELVLEDGGKVLLNLSWREPIQLNPRNLCHFVVRVAGSTFSLVKWEKPRDPERVYVYEREVDPSQLFLEIDSFEVSVLTSHCNSSILGSQVATIRVLNITRTDTTVIISQENGTFPIVPTSSSPFVLSWTSAVFIATVVTATLLICVGTLIVKLSGQKRLITNRFDDENDCKECLPIFAEKELSDPSMIKYDVTSPVGTGQYGNVYKGEVFFKDTNEWMTVAIKVAKEHDMAWKEDFLDEIKLILELGPHPNIVKVLGCCTMSNPPLLITEFMRYGDLLHFLHKCRLAESSSEDVIYSLAEADLVYIALQVAQGMKYIAASKFYHGDLSARNVLIGEGLTAKISDFGLANDLYESGYKRMAPGRKRPLRWVSLETLKTGYCSHKSDVWSFGVLLFEVFSLGATPYHDIPVHEISVSLQEGYRLPKPAACPQEVYNTMRKCWQESPSERPTFSELTEIFECLYQREDPSATSGCSFITNSDLRSIVFEPFFEEDEEPSLPISHTVDTESIMGSDSGMDSMSARVTDVGSLAESGSVITAMSLEAYDSDRHALEHQSSAEEARSHRGQTKVKPSLLNPAFDDGEPVSDSETLTNFGLEQKKLLGNSQAEMEGQKVRQVSIDELNSQTDMTSSI